MNVKLGKYMTAYPISNGNREPWTIKDSRGQYIAYLEWYPQWNQYVMNAESTAVFSHDCLSAISDFCQSLTAGTGIVASQHVYEHDIKVLKKELHRLRHHNKHLEQMQEKAWGIADEALCAEYEDKVNDIQERLDIAKNALEKIAAGHIFSSAEEAEKWARDTAGSALEEILPAD